MNITPRPCFHVLIATVAFSAAASCFATLGAAADAANPPTEIMKYADLNLASPQGAAALYRRIQAAASAVCRKSYEDYVPTGLGLHEQSLIWQCEHRAVRDAVMKISEPLLIAEYNAHNRDRLPSRVTLAQAR